MFVQISPPSAYNRLWTVATQGGPSTLLPAPWAFDGAYAPNQNRIVVDRMSRWDVEWREYRGGQNTSLSILNLDDLSETPIPCERSTDTQPLWLGNTIYFMSDRDWTVNIWAYTPSTGALVQKTKFKGSNVKWLSGDKGTLIFERDGYLHTLDAARCWPGSVGLTRRSSCTVTTSISASGCVRPGCGSCTMDATRSFT